MESTLKLQKITLKRCFESLNNEDQQELLQDFLEISKTVAVAKESFEVGSSIYERNFRVYIFPYLLLNFKTIKDSHLTSCFLLYERIRRKSIGVAKSLNRDYGFFSAKSITNKKCEFISEKFKDQMFEEKIFKDTKVEFIYLLFVCHYSETENLLHILDFSTLLKFIIKNDERRLKTTLLLLRYLDDSEIPEATLTFHAMFPYAESIEDHENIFKYVNMNDLEINIKFI